jgi:hypothetical protein
MPCVKYSTHINKCVTFVVRIRDPEVQEAKAVRKLGVTLFEIYNLEFAGLGQCSERFASCCVVAFNKIEMTIHKINIDILENNNH